MGRVMNFSKLKVVSHKGNEATLHATNVGVTIKDLGMEARWDDESSLGNIVSFIKKNASHVDGQTLASMQPRITELNKGNSAKGFLQALYITAYETRLFKRGIIYKLDKDATLGKNLDMIASKHAEVVRR